MSERPLAGRKHRQMPGFVQQISRIQQPPLVDSEDTVDDGNARQKCRLSNFTEPDWHSDAFQKRDNLRYCRTSRH
jgi:hypothetical protein